MKKHILKQFSIMNVNEISIQLYVSSHMHVHSCCLLPERRLKNVLVNFMDNESSLKWNISLS